jgi:hypothetical protein
MHFLAHVNEHDHEYAEVHVVCDPLAAILYSKCTRVLNLISEKSSYHEYA